MVSLFDFTIWSFNSLITAIFFRFGPNELVLQKNMMMFTSSSTLFVLNILFWLMNILSLLFKLRFLDYFLWYNLFNFHQCLLTFKVFIYLVILHLFLYVLSFSKIIIKCINTNRFRHCLTIKMTFFAWLNYFGLA